MIDAPYPGPRPFARGEAGRFFGREREAAELASLILSHRVVLLYSVSGAGKTSLVHAGIAPELEQKGFDILPTVQFRLAPSAAPAGNRFVAAVTDSWARGSERPSEGTLADQLAAGRGSRRLAVFDQFEDIFTLDPHRWRERGPFFDQLQVALDTDPGLRVLIAMRQEFLAELEPFARRLRHGLRTRYRLTGLAQQPGLDAARRPLEGTGWEFRQGVAEELIDRLLEIPSDGDAGGAEPVMAEFVEPVHLQVVCLRLWSQLAGAPREIETADLERFGGVDEALGHFYDEAVAAAAAGGAVDEAAVRGWFEMSLLTPTRTRATVFRGAVETGGLPNTAVDVLDARHVVRIEPRAGALWCELTHDRMIAPVLESNAAWRRREGLIPLAQLAGDWERLGRDPGALLRGTKLAEAERWAETGRLTPVEQQFLDASRTARLTELEASARSSRRFKRMALALSATMLVAASAGGWAWWENRREQAAALRAQEAQLAAELASLELEVEQARVDAYQEAFDEPGVPGTIAGRIADALNGEPIAAATITLELRTPAIGAGDLAAETTPSGEFLLDDVPSLVEYELTVSAEGYVEEALPIVLAQEESRSMVDVNLVPDTGIAALWNRYGDLLATLGSEYGISPAAAAAVLTVESGGVGIVDGRAVIRFENHVFADELSRAGRSLDTYDELFQFNATRRYTGHRWRPSPDAEWRTAHQSGQSGEWQVLTLAQTIDAELAARATSMGSPQIIGFHFARLGYDSAQDMLADFSASEEAQIEGFFRWVATSPVALEALQSNDYSAFARAYSGASDFEDYATRVRTALRELEALLGES